MKTPKEWFYVFEKQARVTADNFGAVQFDALEEPLEILEECGPCLLFLSKFTSDPEMKELCRELLSKISTIRRRFYD